MIKKSPLAIDRRHKPFQRGATSIEYALIIAIVIAVVIGASGSIRAPLETFFASSAEQVTTWMAGYSGTQNSASTGASDSASISTGATTMDAITTHAASSVDAGILASTTVGSETSGVGNAGDGNLGVGNAGDGNSGNGSLGAGGLDNGNSGDGNAGNGNAGNGNSGDGNLGNGNLGNGNLGNGNSGDGNSGDGNFDTSGLDGESQNGNSETPRGEQDGISEECKALLQAIEMANLSNCVYKEKCTDGLPSDLTDIGWHEMEPEALGLAASDFDNGPFKATVYHNKDTDEYVLSFAGTDEWRDWIDNGGQGMGWTTAQYRQAIQLSSKVNDRLIGKKLTITGHSLGGGLATAAGLGIDRKIIIYNPAGLHSDVAENNSLPYDKADSIVNIYYVEGEVLTTAQDMGPIVIPVRGPLGIPINLTVDGPSAPGTRVPLAPDEEWLEQNIETSVFLSANLERSISLHGMGSVLAALEQEYQQKCGPE